MQEELSLLFAAHFGVAPTEVEPLPESGSSRHYFRLSGGGHRCVGVVSGNVAENEAFIYLSRHFVSKGLPVPEVYAVAPDERAYIQQDLGTVSLFEAVAQGRAKASASFRMDGVYSAGEEDLLCKTIGRLPDVQFRGAEGLDYGRCYPVAEMDMRSIMFDLNYFKYCFLLVSGVQYDEVRLQDEFEKLAASLLGETGWAFMYRDFQARNVMLVEGEPYFIDFQGGRRGPVYYDVASFIWQARSCFPPQLKQRLVETYISSLEKYCPVDRAAFMSRLRIFVLFRTLQVLGAYGFRGYSQKKRHFVESIPYALANLRELLSEPFEAYPYLTKVLAQVAAQGKASESASELGVVSGSASGPEGDRLAVSVMSFSYKRGLPTDDSGNGGGYIFDCRGLNNPGRHERYRRSTGRDADVIAFLEKDGGVFPYLEHVYGVVDPHAENFIGRHFTHLSVSFGCTGGQHRSVYCAEHLARHLAAKFGEAVSVELCHRELGIKEIIGGKR